MTRKNEKFLYEVVGLSVVGFLFVMFHIHYLPRIVNFLGGL